MIEGEMLMAQAAPNLQDAVFLPHTFGDEWNTFSHFASPTFEIEELQLTLETRQALEEAGIWDTLQLLVLTYEQAKDRLGEPVVEDITEAIVVQAMERRQVKTEWKQAAPPDFDSKRRLMEYRWTGTPVAKCGFAKRTRRVLQTAGINSLGDVLNGLKPLYPALYFDLPVFCSVWDRLIALELREGDAQTEWNQQIDNAVPRVTLNEVLAHIQQICSPGQYAVINSRFLLENSEKACYEIDSIEINSQENAPPEITDINGLNDADNDTVEQSRKPRLFRTLEGVVAPHETVKTRLGSVVG